MQMTHRVSIGLITASLLLSGGMAKADQQPAPTRAQRRGPGLGKRTLKGIGTLYTKGSTFTRNRWRSFQQRRQVDRGFNQVVEQHPEELGKIVARGKTRTRTARRVKWGSRVTTLLSAMGSVFYPALIPVAIGSGAVSYGAQRTERRGKQRARVEAMQQAILGGYELPQATDAHYRPLVKQAIESDIARTNKYIDGGKRQLERNKPALLRAQKRARAAVERYRKLKEPYVKTREQLRGAGSQMRTLHQQLEQLEPPQVQPQQPQQAR
jgi:hypothetical protein